jgi:hypothetical protein
MTDGREALAQAIRRNILNGRDNADDFENARRLATYANTVIAALLLETTPRC